MKSIDIKFDTETDPDDVAVELRRIAELVEDGFTSGSTAYGGWWEAKY